MYCCHFLIREPAAGEFDIRLIDLQRVAAAALAAAAVDRQGPGATGLLGAARPRRLQRQLALLHHYLGVRKLRRRDKRLVRAVLRKVRAMQRRLGVPP